MPRKRGEIKLWEYSLVFESLGKWFLFHVCDFKCLLEKFVDFGCILSKSYWYSKFPYPTSLQTILFSWPIAFGISLSFIFFWWSLDMIFLPLNVEYIDRDGKISLTVWICTCLICMHPWNVYSRECALFDILKKWQVDACKGCLFPLLSFTILNHYWHFKNVRVFFSFFLI